MFQFGYFAQFGSNKSHFHIAHASGCLFAITTNEGHRGAILQQLDNSTHMFFSKTCALCNHLNLSSFFFCIHVLFEPAFDVQKY